MEQRALGQESSVNKKNYATFSISRLLRTVIIAASVVWASGAFGASTCIDCHGMPPVDAPYRNITTGGFRGNHQTHLPKSATANNCVPCHDAAAGYTTGHMDGTIRVAANVNSSPAGATYSKGVFFNQTSIPVMGSCSSVNCHFERATPAWGSAAFAVPADCSSCHDAAPRTGNHPAATGSGKKHGDYYGTGVSSCVRCHPDHSVQGQPFAHATSAGKRALQVGFAALPNSGGSYSGNLNAYLPSQSNPRSGTCSSLYCHSNGNGGAPATAAVWGSSLPADCTGCHGGDAQSAAPIVSGKHAAHTNNAAVLGSNFGCADCHAATVNGNRTISSTTLHVDGFKEYTGPRAGGSKNYSASAKTCSSVYCHSNGRGTFVNPPAWNSTATLGCNGCHGTTTTTGAPDYANGGVAAATANSHTKHAGVGCASCHVGTTTGSAIVGGSLLHINGARDVTFSAAAGANGVWNASTKSCSATYCHGSGSIAWGGTLPADCTGCHGGTASSSAPIATNSHPAHLTAAYGPGSYLGTTVSSCQVCHDYSSTQPDPKHANGVVNVLNVAGSACASCHPGTIPVWGSGRLACTVCHAAVPSKLPNGVAAAYKGSFATSGHGLYSVQCTSCHDQNSQHITGTLGSTMRLYGANDNTLCSGCHNGSYAPAMIAHVKDKNATPTPDLCKDCHDVHGTTNLHMIKTVINGQTILFTNTSTGFVQTAPPYRGLCQVCHTLTNHFKAGDASSINHNGNRNCLNCHSHKGGAYAFQPVTNCDSCHGYPPAPAGFTGTHGNYSSARVEDYPGGAGAHLVGKHISPTARPSDGWANCTGCHGNGSLSPATHTMVTPVAPSKVTVDVADRYKFNSGLPLGPAQYSGVLTDGGNNATGSCSNVKCHFKPSKKWSTER